MAVSQEWMTVEKTETLENDDPFVVPAAQLRPYVPFDVKEISFTTSLDTWSNCNVRVLGIFRSLNGKHYLESADEPGGPYKILLVCTSVGKTPESDQVVQVFGEIKLVDEDGKAQSFIDVLFFKIINAKHLCMFKETIECMKEYIPVFVNDESEDDDHNDASYYRYHNIHD